MVVDIAIRNSNLMRVNEFYVLNVGTCCGMNVAACSSQTFSYATKDMQIGETREGLYRICARYHNAATPWTRLLGKC
ncbi:MAG: hypothetical protein IPO63_17755 [Bacteroidetes bacterium]|nr:hypothetical protein [Bacteroidota bacterium]